MVTQIRIYTINKGSLRQFAAEWKEKVYPLRIEHGFQIHSAWLVESTNQFVWLISYDGPESWEAKEEAYYSSAQRKAMEPDPSRLIARSEQYFVESIL
ncbi:MAG: NIPSNAP family protein [Chloroflexi bacterium]|nr:NIPSNAP family protein [Chloroflexota bacterium]